MNDFKVVLRNKLLQLPSAKLHGDGQISLRCSECGDSHKNLSATHFYVKVDLNSNSPIMYHCFRCEASGIITPSILRSLQINDLDMNSTLISYNKKSMKDNNKSIGVKFNNYKFIVPTPVNNEKTELKKEYIENRLGLSLTIDELIYFKTIFHLADFIKVNDIDILTTSKDKAIFLHNNYVGFLSCKNEFINFRDVTGKYKRWDKYSVFKNIENTKKFYTIPNSIDLMNTSTIDINIAEGVFDILGVFYHINECNLSNNIYAAICGCGYMSVIKHFIKLGLIGNVNINIFSDSDKSIDFYRKYGIESIKEWVDKITIYYNEKSKDYGVHSNKIKLKRIKI